MVNHQLLSSNITSVATSGQLLASLYSQSGRSEDALAALRASMALWFKPSPDSDGDKEREGGQAMEEDEDEDEDEDLPSQEFRVECVKLLLELDETTDAATEVCVCVCVCSLVCALCVLTAAGAKLLLELDEATDAAQRCVHVLAHACAHGRVLCMYLKLLLETR